MDSLAAVGQLYCQHQGLLAEYRKLLGLVVSVKTGEIKPETIIVDQAAQTWRIELNADQAAELLAPK